MKWTDEIVDEVRKARDAYAAQFDYDLERMFVDLKNMPRRGNLWVTLRLPGGLVEESVELPAGRIERSLLVLAAVVQKRAAVGLDHSP